MVIAFFIVIGLGVFIAALLVIVVIVVSQRQDFIHPFSNRSSRKNTTKDSQVTDPNHNPKNPSLRSGADLETALVDYLLAQASADTGVNLSRDMMVIDRITNAARKAMNDLAETKSTNISIPFITADGSGPKHFEYTLTQDILRQL
ncbi:MAG: Hsp70 family protein [Anaerolineae bacterium]|nr:Hsp70 family protein [Anaerolineae bacterium]